MGDPPDEYEEGCLCATCWGPGKDFGDVATPAHVTVTLTGVKLSGAPACAGLVEPPNGVPLILDQDIGCCSWYGETVPDGNGKFFMMFYQLTAVSSVLQITTQGMLDVFKHIKGVRCQTDFVNVHVPPDCYFGGTAEVT